MLKTATNGTLGWQVVAQGFGGFAADGTDLVGTFKWSAYTPEGGSWGYADSQELATKLAREELARLTGEDF